MSTFPGKSTYVPRSGVGRSMVHADLHPRNVMYKDDRAILIDLDNVHIDRPFKCLGFSILRFALATEDRRKVRLEASLEAWLNPDDLSDRAFVSDLVHGMLLLETEKVLRILFRILCTGTYSSFVKNVSRIHIANLEVIAPMWRHWCT